MEAPAIEVKVAHTGWLLAVDPSLTRTGIAVFTDGRLVATAVCRAPSKEKNTHVAIRASEIAKRVVAEFRSHWPHNWALACEWPQVYRATRSKGDPNNMLGIAAVACAIHTALAPDVSVFYKPAQWCSQIPKGTTAKEALVSPRARRILGVLSAHERVLINNHPKITHDELDAIGIGLYALDRLHPHKVLPGATH